MPLLPGHLLLETSSVPAGATRHSLRFYRDHTSGLPLRVRDAEDLIARCMRGDFDQRSGSSEVFSVGDMVLVAVLGVAGEVLSVARRVCSVLVMGRVVTVPRAGLSLV